MPSNIEQEDNVTAMSQNPPYWRILYGYIHIHLVTTTWCILKTATNRPMINPGRQNKLWTVLADTLQLL